MADRFSRDDLYRVLGLSPGASAADVTRAYRRQARAWHPDARPGDPAAAARFREVTEAYEILTSAPPPAAPSPPPSSYWAADPPIRVGPVRIEPDPGSPAQGQGQGQGRRTPPAWPQALPFLIGWLLEDEDWPW